MEIIGIWWEHFLSNFSTRSPWDAVDKHSDWLGMYLSLSSASVRNRHPFLQSR